MEQDFIFATRRTSMNDHKNRKEYMLILRIEMPLI